MPNALFELHAEDGFRAVFEKVFADTPATDRMQSRVSMECLDSPVGPLIAAASEESICLLEFTDRLRLEAQLRTLKRRYGSAIEPGPNRWLETLRIQLQEYFAAHRQSFDLPLSYRGTPFQEKVWSMLLKIGYGETWSYRQLAERIGDLSATRAVGTANGANRIAILIPCHRVINASGELGGYGGGLWRKRILLDLEKGQASLPIE